MEIAAKLDDYGKPAWITVMVLGFIFFWPIGLAILAFLIWSGRMGSWKHRSAGSWSNAGSWSCGGKRKRNRHSAQSGNAAFDEYRDETLRRLEDEQKEFFDYLERLRQAKDKSEFDQFMAERGMRPDAPDAPPETGKDKGDKPQAGA